MATYKVKLIFPTDAEDANRFVDCADDEYILDAAEENGFELPYSCRSGSCPEPPPSDACPSSSSD